MVSDTYPMCILNVLDVVNSPGFIYMYVDFYSIKLTLNIIKR